MKRFLAVVVLTSVIIGCGDGGGDDSGTFPTPSQNTTVTDVDGNVYNAVTIGAQVWMKENLKVTKYRNGDMIATTTPATLSTAGEISAKYQWAYDGNEANVATYGRLYTWSAATDSRGICPTGWHLPSTAEWDALTDSIGGFDLAGGHLKEAGTEHWQSPNTGADNSTGFTALPAGYRGFYGAFVDLGKSAYIWTSMENGADYAYGYEMYYTMDDGNTYSGFGKEYGLSVRCIQD